MNTKIKTAILKRLRFYSLCLLVLLVLAQVLALFWYPLEWFSHFSLHGCVLILLASFAFKRRYRYILWAICLSVISWAFFPLSGSLKNEQSIKIISYNIYFENKEKDKEIAFLFNQNADILALTEMGGLAWQNQLSVLQQHYPYSCGHSLDSPFAMQLFSKQKPLSCEVHFIEDSYPYIQAVFPNQKTLFVLHPPPPVNGELANERLLYFQKTAQKIAHDNNAVLLIGDLNNTPFSPIYRRFKRNSGLQDAMYKALPTWKPFFLPLDRVLYRQSKVQARTLSWQYSDHRAVEILWQ